MRGPRIRRMGYVTRAASDLAEVLAPLTSPAPHDVEVRRWCQRLTRTRDWQRLRFTERGVHLANNAVIAWLDPRNVTSRPALLEALRVVRDCARESSAALRETLTERGLYPWATGDVTAPRWWCEACDARRDEAIAHQDATARALDAQHRAQRCALADDVDGCARAHAEALFWATTA